MGQDARPVLERIEKVLAELSRSVNTPTSLSPPSLSPPSSSAGPPASLASTYRDDHSSRPSERLNTAIAWIRARAKRDEAFGDDLFFDPAWSILLELYVHHRQRTAMSITSLCHAAKIPPSTGLRWLTLLEKRGLVTRESDPFDRRRTYALLTDEALERLERALDDAIESNRLLGIEQVSRMN